MAPKPWRSCTTSSVATLPLTPTTIAWEVGARLPSWNKTCPHPRYVWNLVFLSLKLGYVSVPWRGIYILYSFLTSQLRVWNFMEHKTIFGPIMKTFKGHMESWTSQWPVFGILKIPKSPPQSYLLFKYCRQTPGIPGAMLPYCFFVSNVFHFQVPGPAKGQPPTPPTAASTLATPNCNASNWDILKVEGKGLRLVFHLYISWGALDTNHSSWLTYHMDINIYICIKTSIIYSWY